jgi:hypothetical protein
LTWFLGLAVFAWWKIPACYTLPKITVVTLGLLYWSFKTAVPVSKKALWLFGLAVVSSAFSLDPWLSVLGRYNEWSQGLWAASLYLALTGFAVNRKHVSVIAGLLAAMAVLERLHGGPIENHAMTWVGSPVDAGALLALMAPACTPWLWPLILAGVYATGSRAALLAVACAALPGKWRKAVPLIVLAVMLAPARQGKDVARKELWKMGVLAGIEHPILGSGPDTFIHEFRLHRTVDYNIAMLSPTRIQAHAHNWLLELWATMGLPALLIGLWMAWGQGREITAVLVCAAFNPLSFEVWAMAAGFLDDSLLTWAWTGPVIGCVSLLLCAAMWCGQYGLPLIPEAAYLQAKAQQHVYDLHLAMQIARRHPRDAEARYDLGRVMQVLRHPQAKPELETARALDPLM